MTTYKLSTTTKENINNFLSTLEIEWDGQSTPLTLKDGKIVFVYLGQIIKSYSINEEGFLTDIVYEDGFHFDILSENELEIPEYILQHNPLNPYHSF